MPRVDKEKMLLAKKDVEKIKEKNKMSVFYGGELFEWVTNIRGTEQFFLDLYSNKKAAFRLIEKVKNVTLENALEMARIDVDIIAFYDDWGTQSALQISPEMWREFFKKPWKEIIDKVKSVKNDAIIFLHSCGNIEELIPDAIDCGFEIINPIQPEAMNVEKIVKKYKKYINFWGTISAQKLLPYGSKKEIEDQVKNRVDMVNSGAKIIISPSNILGPEVPLKNIDYFVEACKKYCIC